MSKTNSFKMKFINKVTRKKNNAQYNAINIENQLNTTNNQNGENDINNSEISNPPISEPIINKFNKNQDTPIIENKNPQQEQTHDDINSFENQNVDEIISDIIPNYNEQVSIELNHVNLTFEDMKERIDTIKEDFIRTVKRTKTKKETFQVLKDISFKIYKGEKVGIIGYNGAGKSTLLHVITGIYPPDTGYVKTNGRISPLLSLGAGFDYNYSGRDNIMLNGAVLGYDREFLEKKMDEIIEFSELGKFIDIPIKNYSSGMIAKLGFSIATIVDPDILIIDEILGVGDINFRKKSEDKIKSLMDGGTTVLVVSHSLPQIRSLCDKAIWIDNGQMKEIGEVNKVCDHYIKDAEKASNDQLANITFS